MKFPKSMCATLFPYLTVAFALLNGRLLAAEPPSVAAFVEQHCVDCHSGDGAEAGFDLAALAADVTDPQRLGDWVKVHDRVRAGEMPPPDTADLPEVERAAAIAAVSALVTAADRLRQSREGRVVLRRLNRVEFEYTLRDLLQLPGLEVAQRLPADVAAHGFDNVGVALRVSHVQIAQYLEAADVALHQAARLAPRPEAFTVRRQFADIRRYQITKDLVTIDGLAVLLRQPNTAQTPWRIDNFIAPFPGEYSIRIHGRGATYQLSAEGKAELLPPDRPHVVSVYAGTRLLGSFDLTTEPATHQVEAFLNAGDRLTLLIPTLDDRVPKQVQNAESSPAVALEWIEVSGPGDTAWPSASYRVLFDDLPIVEWTPASGVEPPAMVGEVKPPKDYPRVDLPKKTSRFMVASKTPVADSRRLLLRFMNTAFRRPVFAEEVEPYLALVRERLEARVCFDEALLTGYTAVLCSPDFLYFDEQPGRLADHALACRLSYFLWRSLPDARLRGLADRGELHADGVLASEVERLLDDPKSQRFVEDFTGQWLDLRRITVTQPDEQLYPEFDQLLLESMIAETHAFFAAMLQRDLPARSVVDADIAFVNAPLATLYGLPGVDGVALREVTLPNDCVRGGLLTQASILKVTANGTTTSPVTRGAWVLDRLLDSPAPPPPPNIPAIEPDVRGATTVRELLVKHRADASCASCHAKIDPPGFALESFDVIGGWRTRYRALETGDRIVGTVKGRPVRYRWGPTVDPSGSIADGREFADIDEFKTLLLRDERQLARNLARRLLVFSTGAGVSFADRARLETILDQAKPSGYGLRTLIHEVVSSEAFRVK